MVANSPVAVMVLVILAAARFLIADEHNAAQRAVERGDKAFASGDYRSAIDAFTEAIGLRRRSFPFTWIKPRRVEAERYERDRRLHRSDTARPKGCQRIL